MGYLNCLGSREPDMPPPNLSVRNLTTTPLQLCKLEYFEGQRVRRGNPFVNATAVIASFVNATEFVSHELRAAGESHTWLDVDVWVGPFETRFTEIQAAGRGHGVARLTFRGGGHTYEVDAPSPSNRSHVMKKVDGGGEDFTAVYDEVTGFLAIYSSSNLASWMSELRDEYPLSMLSIPGTHNSPTCHVALPSVRCQAVTVREQLENGVRFLDVRVSANPKHDSLTLVHSAFPISLVATKYFHDLLSECYTFLDANPGEALIMSLKKEGIGRGSEHQMSRYLKDRYFGQDSHRWFISGHIPRLHEVRGKIVLVRRFGVDDTVRKETNGHFGIDAQRWPDNCEDGTVGDGLIRVQDFYEVGASTNILKKISFTKSHLERAAELKHFHEEPHPMPFFVNFLSASNFFNASCWPERVAAKVNPAVIDYLCMNHGEDGKGERGLKVGDAGTGIVVTDWVGANGDWDLIRCIVGMNSRLKLKQKQSGMMA